MDVFDAIHGFQHGLRSLQILVRRGCDDGIMLGGHLCQNYLPGINRTQLYHVKNLKHFKMLCRYSH